MDTYKCGYVQPYKYSDSKEYARVLIIEMKNYQFWLEKTLSTDNNEGLRERFIAIFVGLALRETRLSRQKTVSQRIQTTKRSHKI